MRSLISHVRHTIRRLLKSPGFTITAVLTLGLGIGANTAIFSLINGVLLKPLPYPQPDRLVRIFQPTQKIDRMPMTYADYIDFLASQHTLQGLTILGADDFQISGNGDPERLDGAYVTGSFFKVLGRAFVLGRPFGESEVSSTANVVVLSERLWRSRFHADPRVLGTNLTLSGRSFEIVGVTPDQANEIVKIDLYLPFSFSPVYTDVKSRRSGHMFRCIGRLKDGVTLEEAQADFEVINRNLIASYPGTNTGFGVKLVPLLDSVVEDFSTTLWLLGGAVVCLLLVTCANTANLLLARARERTKEITVRAALGASRERLFIQLLSESLVLALLGGVAGFVISGWAISLIKALDPGNISRLQTIEIDSAALFFAFALTLLTALLFGLLPAVVVSQANLASALRDQGGRTGTSGLARQRGQRILIIGQVALASVLLIAAGLLLRSFLALQSVPLGFSSHHILSGEIYLANTKYSDPKKRRAFFDTLLDKIRQVPGVSDAGLNDHPPFCDEDYETLNIAGQPFASPGDLPWMVHQIISADYFRVMGIPLLRGRFFDERDQSDAENVVIINQSIARRFFPGQDPLGKQLDDLGSFINKPRHLTTIIGVVGDVQHYDPAIQQTPFQTYFPYTQLAGAFGQVPNYERLLLRINNSPESMIPALRKTVATIDPELPLGAVGSYDDIIANTFTTERLSLIVVSLFSGTALLLAAVGLYAVLSYSVNQRIQEIGVRMALGAKPGNIVKLITRQGLEILGLGLIIGVLAGTTLAQLVGNVLYGVSATDPLALLSSMAVLALAAALACLLPAFRAMRIDPITALRE